MNALRPILVIGGTRGTRLLIVRLLHEQGQPVRVLARDPGRSSEMVPREAQVVRGALTNPDNLPDWLSDRRDRMISIPGNQNRDGC
jgi:uncharacterized protein YbjT (DUF2867 family)